MDKIFITGLSIAERHGVQKHERHIEQEFVLDISAVFDARPGAVSDKIHDTIDYVRFRDIAKEVIAESTHYLIEKVATLIAERILEDVRILEVSVTLRKPAVLPSGVPGISITRTRA